MRVLIVEDEAIIREGLMSMLDWQQEGFSECIGLASAVDALEVLEEKGAELVITDIYMSALSGLEMIEMANRMGIHTSFIILTGHERFDYAQRAVALGVKRFLIKPISCDELLPMVREVLSDLREKNRLEHYLAQTEERLREYGEVVKEKFWSDLIGENPLPLEEIIRRADNYGVTVDFPVFQCAALIACQEHVLNLAQRMALCQIIKGILCDNLLCLNEMNDLLVLVLSPAMEEEQIRMLYTAIEANLHIKVKLGIAKPTLSIASIHSAAEDAMEAAKSIRRQKDNHVAYYEDLLHTKNQHIAYPHQLEKNVLDMLRFQDGMSDAAVNAFLDAVFETGHEQTALMLLRFQVALYRFSEEYGLTDIPSFGVPDIEKESRTAAGKRFLHLIHLLAGQKANSQQRVMISLVEEAKRVMNEEYGNAELNISLVAKRLHITSSYLSRLFHSIAGETCMNYLTNVRIQAAQKLLAGSSIKSYEIAQMVGYDNPNYFSALFKKHTGVPPRQYRTERENEASPRK